MLICVGLLLAALVGFNLFRTHMFAKFMAANAAPPATVTAVIAGYQSGSRSSRPWAACAPCGAWT